MSTTLIMYLHCLHDEMSTIGDLVGSDTGGNLSRFVTSTGCFRHDAVAYRI